jgi:hypothetical protein
LNAPLSSRVVRNNERRELTLEVMRREFLDLQTGTVEARALERLILQFITQYFLDNESGAQQADWRAPNCFTATSGARTVSLTSCARSPSRYSTRGNRYMRDVRFAFIGDARQRADQEHGAVLAIHDLRGLFRHAEQALGQRAGIVAMASGPMPG